MLTVCCFLWRDSARRRSYQFTPEHIRIWANMVRRHLMVPHRLVCVTDYGDEWPYAMPDFYDSGGAVVRLDMTKHVPSTCFVKLMLWRPDIGEILGDRILYTDLDCVVTGSLDEIASRTEDVVLWRNPNWTGGGNRAFYQGSIQLLTAGARPELWEDFDPETTPQWVNRRFGGAEQAWISERLSWDEAYWTDADGIYGAGRLVAGKMGKGVQSELPENAKIVFLPGNRAPWQPETQARHPWITDHYR